jgi:hypothetical protein
LQVQLVNAALPEGELEFDGQSLHVDASAVCPVAFPYLPAPQAVHDASEVCPAATPYFPAPQAVHDASAVCAVAFPYLPAPQSVQFPMPLSDFHLPATHAMQVPPAGSAMTSSSVRRRKLSIISRLSLRTHRAPGSAAPENPELQVQLVNAALPEGELEFDGQSLHVEPAVTVKRV